MNIDVADKEHRVYIKELQAINILTNVQVISVSGQNFDIRVRKSWILETIYLRMRTMGRV